MLADGPSLGQVPVFCFFSWDGGMGCCSFAGQEDLVWQPTSAVFAASFWRFAESSESFDEWSSAGENNLSHSVHCLWSVDVDVVVRTLEGIE